MTSHDNKERQPFYWLNKDSVTFLERGYLSKGEDAKQRIRDIADNAEKILGIKGFSDKFYDYMSKGYYSLSSPVWANFGKDRGLPISCYSIDIQDNMGDIMRSVGEIGMMSKLGGGTGGFFGKLRPRGSSITDNGESSGSVHFMELFDKLMDVASQGSVRRGAFSPYLPVEHPDINEFLKIGTEGNPIQGLNHAVTVTDKWMEEMIAGDTEKREVWAKIIQSRGELGYPYIFFHDTVNNLNVDVYKDKSLTVNHSNLCSEITLPTNEEWSFVCCLSSLNVLHYDEWKDTDAVETLVYFLDAVMSEFITKLEEMRDSGDAEKQQMFMFMKKAYDFAKDNRALGMGTIGLHSYYQSKMIPFESMEATKHNAWIHKTVYEKSYKASKELAELFGEPKIMKGYGRRNSVLTAIAPTSSSAFILGQVSQSIEPYFSNSYVKDLAKTKITIHNPYLKKLLQEKGKDTRDVWLDIRMHDGSVQHLDFLTQHEKDVFKTFSEINQYVILDQASIRQQFIDQAQSLNIMVNPAMSAKEINELYLFAWRNGIKTLYYQHSTSAVQEFNRNALCMACEA